MGNKHIPIPLDSLPPEEPVYVNPLWEDEPEAAVPPVNGVEAQIAKIITERTPVPVSAPLEVAVERVAKKVPMGVKVGRKPTGTAMTNAERQAKWRGANRAVALQRQRDAMKEIRRKSLNNINHSV